MSNRSAIDDCPIAAAGVCVPVARLQEQFGAIQKSLDRIEGSVTAGQAQQNDRIGALEGFANRARGIGLMIVSLGGVGGIVKALGLI